MEEKNKKNNPKKTHASSGLKSSGSNFGKAELTSTLLALVVATHNRASQRLSYTLFSPAFLHQTSQRQGFLV